MLGGIKMELVQQVNKLLKEGYNVEDASIHLGKGKEWARRTLSKQGYKYNRKTNQYELKNDSETTKEIAKVVERTQITKVVTDSYPHQKQQFKAQDIDILYKIIAEYKIREQIRNTHIEDDRLENRNIRVYVEHYKQFANWCKENNITQADALRMAIDKLIK